MVVTATAASAGFGVEFVVGEDFVDELELEEDEV